MMRSIKHGNVIFFIALLLLANVILASGRDANASSEFAPELQPGPFLTPTPGPDGRIVYIVQKGDDFWTIAAIAGITLEELYALNGIQPGDYAIEGMELVLGLAGPVEPTIDPNAVVSSTAASPTSTPEFNAGEICVLLFLDANGNARLDEGEVGLLGGQISIVDVSGTVAVEASTGDNPDGQCFADLDAGDYNVSAAVPEEYNPTTSMSMPLRLLAGDIKYVQFGAQPSAAIIDQIGDQERSGSLLFGILGIVLLLTAGGLAYYASRLNRQSPKFGR